MQIALVAAMTKNRVIGKDHQMPWHLPADLQHFKQKTRDKPIVMGRKTFESIGRPLPHRRNIVLSQRKDLHIPGVEVYSSLAEAMIVLREEAEVMIVGGQTLFSQTLPMAHYMYLTMIDTEMEGDTFFPTWNATEWRIIAREAHAADARHAFPYEFIDYKRREKY